MNLFLSVTQKAGKLLFALYFSRDKDDDAGQNKTVKPTATMALFKDGTDISGTTVKLTDVVTMLLQLDNDYIGNL